MSGVLIVDDKPENLYLLRSLLQGHGYRVEEARHGAEALRRARRTPPQLVISDLLMPVMDGYTLLRQWKADERLQRIPFVVYTATYTEPGDQRLALDLGADAFILKPAEPEPFMARIREVLAKKERGELPPAGAPQGAEQDLLKEYSEVLVRKLEQKALQLEQTNRALQQDIARRQQAEAALRQSRAGLEALTRRLLEVQETERRNINRELHDRVGQSLSVLNLNLKLIRSGLPADLPAAAGARFDDAQKLLEATTAQVRDVMAELHPPALDDYGLYAALRAYAASFGAQANTPISVNGGDLSPRLPPAVEMALFRIAQEALANAAKHARAQHIDVTLAARAEKVTLTIGDDGVGFDAANTDPEHPSWGFSVMRERAKAADATLRLESAPGRGTRVIVEVVRGR